MRSCPTRTTRCASPALLRALLQPAEAARDFAARPTCGAHGGAAELSERAAPRDRETGCGRPARRDRQQRAAHARRRRSGDRRLLTPRDPYWIAITRIAAGPRMTMNR